MRPRPQIPTAVEIVPPGTVTVTWRDGRIDRHSARELRLRCPCARCVHEVTGQPLLDPATVPADLAALSQRPVGNYAVQFAWSDGHNTGLYTYVVLRGLGEAPPSDPH